MFGIMKVDKKIQKEVTRTCSVCKEPLKWGQWHTAADCLKTALGKLAKIQEETDCYAIKPVSEWEHEVVHIMTGDEIIIRFPHIPAKHVWGLIKSDGKPPIKVLGRKIIKIKQDVWWVIDSDPFVFRGGGPYVFLGPKPKTKQGGRK